MVQFTQLTPAPQQSQLLQALGAQLARGGANRRGLSNASANIAGAILQAQGIRRQAAEREALTDATRSALADIAGGADRATVAQRLVDVAPRLALQLGLEQPEQAETFSLLENPQEFGFGPGAVVERNDQTGQLRVVRKSGVLSPEAEAQKQRLAEAGATRVETNVGPQGQRFGKPPKDHIFARNEDGSVAVEPIERDGKTFFRPITIPIGEAAVEQEQREEAAVKAEEQKKRFANIVTTNIDDALKIVDEAQIPVTGFGALASSLPGTPARDLAAKVDTIRANVGFDRLQALRDASPTGGALGQVSERENLLLQSTIANLDQAQSKEQFVNALKEVRKVYLDIIHGPSQGRQQQPQLTPDQLQNLSDEEFMELLR